MCGHRGLLVNVMFSLTGIFHGSAGGMSSGHTWYQGTPEWSHKIPLGKPGLVIPRCETLASRSVTFPLHQRRVQRWTPSTPSLFLATRICNGGSKGGRGARQRGKYSLLHPTTTTTSQKIHNYIHFSTQAVAHETVFTQLENNIFSRMRILAQHLCAITISESRSRLCTSCQPSLYSSLNGFGRTWLDQMLFLRSI